MNFLSLRFWIPPSVKSMVITTSICTLSLEEVSDSIGGQYETGSGWVGVTTYMDNHGNLRVKKEVMVMMSGITTGNLPLYPPA